MINSLIEEQSKIIWKILNSSDYNRGTLSDETRLKEDLQDAVHHAHPAAHEGEEGHDELDEVIAESLKAMKPPGRTMHVV